MWYNVYIMNIRKSTENDINQIMDVYSYARDFMVKHGNPKQWAEKNWPPVDLIHDDIKNGNSYVCVNDSDSVIGTFYYAYGKNIEPAYNMIEDGNWLSDTPYGVIHRIAGNGSEKGIGAFCINWAYKKCKHVRIDTHEDNKVMQNLLKKIGFTHCGTIYIKEDNYPRYAYEKI